MVWDLLVKSWNPAVEILILTVGIYFALMFIRGTPGAPVATGLLLLLLAIAGVTMLLDLRVLKWLMVTFLGLYLLAVVVIFQPELRRMLARLGNMEWLASTREQRENIEVVLEAVERLAEERCGALIAIERTIELDEAVESGVSVDCVVTPEMLETIFFPNTAMHDGGVIIRGDRIARAACIFPLTQRQNLSRSLGTRHRAAIGLSEETDAVVVVVSEETGSIGYAYRGQLVRGLTVEELRAFLTSVLVKRTPEKRGLEALLARLRSRRPRTARATAGESAG